MKDPLLVVAAHDAGGAEIISSWLRRFYYPYPGLHDRVRFCLEGPAVGIFERKLGKLTPCKTNFREVRLVVSGTSATSELEKDVVEWGISRGVRTAVWLDHWKNYAQRFRQAPSEIWVADPFAANLAAKLAWTDARPKIIVQGNPYLDEVVADVKRLQTPEPHQRLHVLIVYDRGKEFWLHVGDWPHDCYEIRHRAHPADYPPERTLAEDLAWADTVVGWDSMALVVALMAGRRTYSALSAKDRNIPLVQERGLGASRPREPQPTRYQRFPA